MECACIGDKPENVQLCGLHYWAAKKFAATAEQERDELQSALQSKHNYGTASPGEQEEGWRNYCKRTGWDPNSHPAAKSAYIEGYCDGDSYSEGDESRVVLRKEVERLRAAALRAWPIICSNRCQFEARIGATEEHSDACNELKDALGGGG